MSQNLIKESTYAINKAAQILDKGGLVSIKAETVYGLACDPINPEAILKLYNNRKLRRKIGAASLAAGKKYDREILAKKMLRLLEVVSDR